MKLNMYNNRVLSLVMAAVLLLQIFSSVFVPDGKAAAASSGPVLINKNPIDKSATVPSNLSQLVMTFDEGVMKGTGSAAVSIRRVSDNTEVDRFVVASDYRVSIDTTNPTIARISLSTSLEVGKSYYVLVDSGAFTGITSRIGFAGINSATAWNFTVIRADTVSPSLIETVPSNGSGGVSVFSPIKLNYNMAIYPASGNVQIQNQTSGDITLVNVVSSNVTGGGTSTITITPPYGFVPSQNYQISVPTGAFQDAAGNNAPAASLTFSTGGTPIPFSLTAPTANSQGVDINAPFQITFGSNVDRGGSGGSPKYIYIKRIADNSTFQSIDISSSYLNIQGDTATISHSALEGNTGYYILVDAGAFKSGDLLFSGITNASAWSFTTKAINDNQSVSVSKLEPATGGILSNNKGQLVMRFNKPVYAGSGNIVIRSKATGNILTSIPVTSPLVTGAGTSVITIKSDVSFADRNAYYVQIGNQAFMDVTGNKYAGLSSATDWSFTVSSDDSFLPAIVYTTPTNNATNVSTRTSLKAVFNRPIQLANGATAVIHPAGSASTIYTTTLSIDPTDSTALIIEPQQALPGNTSLYVEIGVGSVLDMAGNAFAGILNEYQWTFKTLSTSTGAPALSSIAMASSAQIVLTYDKELDLTAVPFPAQYYVSINNDTNNARPVSNVVIGNNTVTLTLQSGILNGQKVKVSYSPSTNTTDNRSVKSLSGTLAASFSGREATYSQDQTQPKVVSGSITGNIVTLQFNEPLADVDPNVRNQFTVNAGGYSVGISSIAVNGSSLVLTLNSSGTTNSSVYVNYATGTYAVKDKAGNMLAAFNTFYIQNTLDTTKPVLNSIGVSGNKVTLNYNKGLNSTTVPSKGQFSVLVKGSSTTISSVAVTANTVVLTLGSSVATTSPVVVSYSKGNPAIADLSGNAADSFSGVNATVYAAGGSLQAATVNGNVLQMVFSGALDPSYIPLANQFSIRANGSLVPVKSATVNGAVATIILNSSVAAGQTVLLSYTSSTNGLRSLGSDPVASITNFNVINQTGTNSYPGDSGNGTTSDPKVLTTNDADITTSVSPARKSAKRYTLLAERVANAYKANNGGGSTVSFTVPASEGAGLVAVPLSQLQQALAADPKATFKVNYSTTSFDIPLKAIDFAQTATLLNAGGTTGYLLLQIDTNASTLASSLQSALNRSKAQTLVSPVSFSVSVMSGTNVKPLDEFTDYASRSISSPTVLSTGAAVVWYDSDTGNISYAPTAVTNGGGGSTVTFQRKGNGVYAVVSGSVSFNDISTHWAMDDIQKLANKYIVTGRKTNTFDPKSNITRAEFAEFVARGLGLSGDKATAATQFKDVSKSSSAASYIGAAYKAGIVKGNTDGTFTPGNSITRQEMAAMMIRAMEYVGQTQTLPQSSTYYLQPFKDSQNISSWAVTDVAKAVKAGIVNGLTTTSFGPTQNASRAEAVLMIERMLVNLGYLQM